MQIKNFSTQKKIINESIKFILNICRGKTRVNIALSGGNTPKEIYQALDKKLKSTKKQIEFFQVDERYVPAAHPNSNQKMIRESFASPNPLIHFHFFDTSLPIQKSLKEYSKKLPKNFDLTILGIGPDGHTASLFPHSKALTNKSATAHTTTKEFAVKDRLTLTFPIILKSKNILVLLKNKPEIIRELRTPTKSPADFPAHKLKSHKKLSVYFSCPETCQDFFLFPKA